MPIAHRGAGGRGRISVSGCLNGIDASHAGRCRAADQASLGRGHSAHLGNVNNRPRPHAWGFSLRGPPALVRCMASPSPTATGRPTIPGWQRGAFKADDAGQHARECGSEGTMDARNWTSIKGHAGQ